MTLTCRNVSEEATLFNHILLQLVSPASLVEGVQLICLNPLGCGLHLVHITLPDGSVKPGQVFHLRDGVTSFINCTKIMQMH